MLSRVDHRAGLCDDSPESEGDQKGVDGKHDLRRDSVVGIWHNADKNERKEVVKKARAQDDH